MICYDIKQSPHTFSPNTLIIGMDSHYVIKYVNNTTE